MKNLPFFASYRRLLQPGFLILVLFLLAIVGPRPVAAQSLTQNQATRIADIEARKELRISLREYEHVPVLYFPKQDRWYVGYQIKGQKSVAFAVDVYDKTRKAWVVTIN